MNGFKLVGPTDKFGNIFAGVSLDRRRITDFDWGDEKEAVKDKPFNAYKKLSDSDILSRSKALLDYLCNKRNRLDSELLDRVIEYKNIDELKSFVNI